MTNIKPLSQFMASKPTPKETHQYLVALEEAEMGRPLPREKYCPACNQDKSFDDFHFDQTKELGLAYRCRACSALYSKKYREANKEKLSAKVKQYRQDHLEEVRAQERERRNKAQ